MQAYDSAISYMLAPGVILGIAFFPILALFIFYLSGYYNSVYFKSRLQELITTLLSTFCLSIIMFFIILINDNYVGRLKNYELIISMWVCVFFFVYIARLLVTEITLSKIRKGGLKFNTLIIGNNTSSIKFINTLNRQPNSGYNIVGIISFPNETEIAHTPIPVHSMDRLDDLCSAKKIHTIIIVPNRHDKDELFNLINKLFHYNIPIKITPELYDIITSRIRHTNIFEEPLVDIAQSNMPESQKSIKRALDIILSALALAILSPMFAIVSILIKRNSPGNIIYKQERIGQHGKPFNIYKFRTMISDAEKDNIPQLSSNNDSRITSVGKVLRKYRIDETPQFWNVLKGDMSLVGPRPERKYFVDQIIKSAPYYTLIYQVRPGITSLGMVKFGYATNIKEMIERAKYDLIYIENMSILIDLKIITFTIKTVVTGKGL